MLEIFIGGVANSFLLLGEFCDVKLLHQTTLDNTHTQGKHNDRVVKSNTFLLQRKSDELSKTSYWHNRWASGQSKWHKTDVNPFLLRHFEKLKVTYSCRLGWPGQ